MTIEEALSAQAAKVCMGCANDCKQPHFAIVVSCRLMRTRLEQTLPARGHEAATAAIRASRR